MTGNSFERDVKQVVGDYAQARPSAGLEQWLADIESHASKPRRSRGALVRPLATAVVLLVVAGFGFRIYSGGTADTPLPSGQPLSIVTEPSPPQSDACLTALLSGVEMKRSGSTVIFGLQSGSTAGFGGLDITWPYGAQALLVDGKAELFAPDGILIGTEGERFPNLGGGLGIDNRFHVCRIDH